MNLSKFRRSRFQMHMPSEMCPIPYAEPPNFQLSVLVQHFKFYAGPRRLMCPDGHEGSMSGFSYSTFSRTPLFKSMHLTPGAACVIYPQLARNVRNILLK